MEKLSPLTKLEFDEMSKLSDSVPRYFIADELKIVFCDVSLTTTDAETPPADAVSFSEPSVNKSFNSVTEIVAMPLELTTAFPLSDPPETSEALIPDKVYGTEVPDASLVVVSVKVATEPSLTELVNAVNE